jgi:NADPH:quinone reductase-like Zn-dependent oxidoreductase
MKDNQRMIRHLGQLLGSKACQPVIARRYPLDEIVDAHRYVETEREVGDVVVDAVPD